MLLLLSVCLSVCPSVRPHFFGTGFKLNHLFKFFKLNGYTTSRKRKKPIYFQGQRSKIKVSGLTLFRPVNVCTMYRV